MLFQVFTVTVFVVYPPQDLVRVVFSHLDCKSSRQGRYDRAQFVL